MNDSTPTSKFEPGWHMLGELELQTGISTNSSVEGRSRLVSNIKGSCAIHVIALNVGRKAG